MSAFRPQHLWQALVRWGFQRLYNELAWTYDFVSWAVSLGRWQQWQRATLDYVQGERVLEIAHGPGHMLVALAQRGHQVIGLDKSAAMGRLAQRRGVAWHIPQVRAEVPYLPFAAAQFDTVLVQFPTAFIAERGTMEAIYRLLRPNGRLVVLLAGQLMGEGVIYRLIDWLFAITGQKATADDHTIAQRQRDFRAAMCEIGFEATWQTVPLTDSVITVIVATKSPS